jgi:hypothetical protein
LALYNLKEFKQALETLREGEKRAENESESKRSLFTTWIEKCRKELPNYDQELAEEMKKMNETLANEQNKPPVPPPVKYEWYQTEAFVTVSVLAKNLNPADVNVTSKEKSLSIVSNDQEKVKIDFNFNLANEIRAEETQVKFLSTKLEIKLKKGEWLHWKTLEVDPKEVLAKQAVVNVEKKREFSCLKMVCEFFF